MSVGVERYTRKQETSPKRKDRAVAQKDMKAAKTRSVNIVPEAIGQPIVDAPAPNGIDGEIRAWPT